MSELVPYDPGNVARWAAVLIPAAQLAERIAGTEFVPLAMRDKPDVVVAAIMYGDEIGIGPMQALASIHVVEGRPAPSAELMRAMILRAGHTFTVHELTGTRARVSGLRAGRPESERQPVEWTLDMARAAGLLHKQNWQRYPRAMLLARATGDLARQLFPDVVKGLGYVAEDVNPDELDAWAPPGVEPEPETPPAKLIQRRTRPRTPGPELPPHVAPGRATEADREPVAPRPPAPTRVETVDRPIPELTTVRPYLEREPDPEPGDPEPGPVEVAPPTIMSAQLRALQIKLRQALGTDDRAERLAFVSAFLGRPILTTTTLPRADGFRLLDFLSRVESGEATWEWVNGELRVTDLRQPPPDEG